MRRLDRTWGVSIGWWIWRLSGRDRVIRGFVRKKIAGEGLLDIFEFQERERENKKEEELRVCN